MKYHREVKIGLNIVFCMNVQLCHHTFKLPLIIIFTLKMVSVKFCAVFFSLIFGHVVASEFVSSGEFEALKRRVENLEASRGKDVTSLYFSTIPK